MSSEYALEVHDLRKWYRGGAVKAVDGVSFSVRRGEVVGLLGANGAGKTTTIKSICTLIRPTSGTIRVGGEDAVAHPGRALPRIAAVLEGNRNIYWQLSPRENMEFFAGIQGFARRDVRPQVDALLEVFRLQDKADTPVRMLSRGMQQKVAITCAMIKQTELLMLDEPTLGLDVKTNAELRTVLREIAATGERTVMLSSHDLGVVQSLCDRIIIVHQGRVVTDERIGTLLELFRPRGFRVRVDGALSEAQRAHVGRLFGEVAVQADADGGSTLDVEVPEPQTVYDLVDALRASGAMIRSVERRSRSLEEVFLSLTHRA
jgi:ABC-2 type transport system ATP-binding protein